MFIHTHNKINIGNCLSLHSFRYPIEDIKFSIESDILPCAAIHPWDVKYSDALNNLEAILPSLFAMSEMGLDKLQGDFEEQKQLFTKQLQLAIKYNKVVIIHSVHSHNEVLNIIKAVDIVGVIHSFIGSKDIADRYIKQGCYISVSPQSIRSSKTVEAIKTLPLSSIFIESDDTNDNIVDIYKDVADILDVDIDILQHHIFNNFKTIFQDEFLRTNRTFSR